MDYTYRLDDDNWQSQHELYSPPFWSEEDNAYLAVTNNITFYASSADAAFWQYANWYEAENKLRQQESVLPC